jgi:hypothetical protein
VETDIARVLKASHIIAPAVALIATVFWNVWQWRAVAEQEQQVDTLRGRITEALTHPAVVSSMKRSHVSKTKPLTSSGAIDWKDFSARLTAMDGDGIAADDLRAMADIQERISAMTRDELIAALAEVASLDLDEEEKASLEEMLTEPLIEKDPQYALERYAERIKNDDDAVGWQLSSALEGWAKTDPVAATRWMDSQIAAGLFDSKSLDGRSQTRMEFEAALVGQLLGADPAAAQNRIAALPEDQRREALEQVAFSELSPAEQKLYAEMIRGLVPQDERAGSFTHAISELIPDGGYDRVSSFLDDIQATPEERSVSAREAANAQLEGIATDRAVTRADVDAMRQWLQSEAPGTVDRVTGEALGDASQEDGEFGFEQASALALEYHRKSGNDDVLVAFLESFAARSNLQQALHLADKITDPKRRQEIIDTLQ